MAFLRSSLNIRLRILKRIKIDRRGNRSRIGESPFITERILTKHTAGEVAHYRARTHAAIYVLLRARHSLGLLIASEGTVDFTFVSADEVNERTRERVAKSRSA